MNDQISSELKDYYKGKKVLITGGLGFIGSNLALRLFDLGAEVTIADNMIPDYGGNFFNIQPIRDKTFVTLTDIRDDNAIRYLIAEKDVLFHLAGQVCHVQSLTNPFPDIDINIKGTAVVAEECKRYNPNIKIVFTGTRGEYGPSTHLPVSEDAPTNPKGIYEISNLTAEKILQVYNDIHGVKSVMLRLTNIYGYRAQMKHSRYGVVNWFVRLAMDNQVIPVFGNGKYLRDFLFVDDCVEGMLKCGMVEEAVGEVINLGHDKPSSFLEVAEVIKDIHPGARWEFQEFSPERKAQEPGDFYSDISKIRRICNWNPRTSLREGLEKTIEYYKQYKSHYW